VELLSQVGISDPARRLQDYPHLLSGGMNQRVMIAMAIACNPRLLIADEPTTALDVTIQAQILDLLRQLQRERGMALVLITHNMGVVAEMAQRVAVMYAGQVVEDRPAQAIPRPEHPYTAALLAAMPERSTGERRLATIPGMVPGLYDRPRGCLFSPRCPDATLRCHREQPALVAVDQGRARCHYPITMVGREAAITRDRHVGALAARRRRPSTYEWQSAPVVEPVACGRSTPSAAACCASRPICRQSATFHSRSRPSHTRRRR
jgi:dipeptide transport system ATP-binding protein